MRKLVTSEQALHLDRRTQELDGVSVESLMENAGKRVAIEIQKDYSNLNSVIVLVGPGNNGGDGLVLGRFLVKAGVKVVLVAPHEGDSQLWKKKKAQLLEFQENVTWISGDGLSSFTTSYKDEKWDLLVDAAFGVGLSRPLSSLWVSVLEFLGERSVKKVAVDLPSGLDATTGLKGDGVLNFDHTYSLGVAKLGLVIGDGPLFCGKIKVLEIGFSPQALQELNPRMFYFGLREALKVIPAKCRWDSNKSSRGHLLVIAGSPGMEGAGALCSLAAARMGAGYVTWARWPEKENETPAVILSVELDAELHFLDSMKKPSAVVIGPGLGINERSRKLIKNIYKQFAELPVVVDADALHLLKAEGLYPVPSQWILTPHVGELARLLGIAVEDVNNNRLQVILRAQKELGGTLLLKGYRSMVADAQGRVFVIGAGGPVLAKAGTGDVLAGMIGGCMTKGMKSELALIFAAFVHGRSGDLYARKWKNDFTMIATDLMELIPMVIRGLYGKK